MADSTGPEADYHVRSGLVTTRRAGLPERVFVASRQLKQGVLPAEPVPLDELRTSFFQSMKKERDPKGESRIPVSETENRDLAQRANLLD
jgi:hypothetical protein